MKAYRTEKQKRGDWGEEKACVFLQHKGYRILCRKYRCRRGEIDIIARKDSVLAFVEVKTRASTAYGLPCQAVDRKKQHRLRLSAEYYMLCNPWTKKLQPHWDIIEILCLPDGNYIRHLENAF